MSVPASKTVFADALLNQWLSGMGLDVEYVRAEGNTLYYLDSADQEVAVVDHLCGFGALIFGHNHPEIVAHAKAVLDARKPVHAQLSKQSHAHEIGAVLNAIVSRETGSDARYSVLYANSGAEAIEICMKHAELERQARIAALTEEISANIGRVRAAVRAGTADNGAKFDELIADVDRKNSAVLGKGPVYLTLEHAFHGKLVGSIQLTQNEQWRTPFTALASPARFLPVDQPDVLAKVVEDEREVLLDVVLEGRRVQVVEREFPVVAAFFVEPIRGGAGMKPVSEEYARQIERVCKSLGCPLVVDEVQSGFGRTGAFFASSQIGLQGDYYTLAKSIGGGIAKNAAVLIRQSRFRPEIEVIHSSTFAKDGFSGAIAAKVLEMLEADDGKAYRMAAERGQALRTMLTSVAKDFPEVVADVCGRGLMLAMDLHDQSGSASDVIAEHAKGGVLGYLLSGYLLREHRIRVLPAGPVWNSLRFEPSIYLTDAEIEQTERGLRALLALLREQDGRPLALTK